MCDLPMLEAASVAEAYRLAGCAFELSERAGAPVSLRLVAAIANSYAAIDVEEPGPLPEREPVVVIKAGRAGSGRRAALSHTGSLAGADAVYDAALRQCGAIRVKTVEEMFDVCKGFVHLPRLPGRRVVIVTNSGGPGVMAADVAEESGLQVAEPSPALRQRLVGFLPAHCAFRNPIDLTVEGTESGYREALAAALDEYDAALTLNVATPYLDSLSLARGVCEAAARRQACRRQLHGRAGGRGQPRLLASARHPQLRHRRAGGQCVGKAGGILRAGG